MTELDNEYWERAQKFADFNLWLTRQGLPYRDHAAMIAMLVSTAVGSTSATLSPTHVVAHVIAEYTRRGLDQYPAYVQINELASPLGSVGKYWARSEQDET